MLRRATSFAMLAVSLAQLGCAATVRTTFQAEPGAPPKHYARLAVLAVGSDLRLRIAAESSFVRAGLDAGAELIPWHTLFFAGRVLSDSEIARTMRQHQIPAVLLIADATTDAPTLVASARADASGGSSTARATQRVVQDKFTFASRVIDIADEQPVWVGATRIERQFRGYDTDEDLVNGLARDVVRSLVLGGVVQATASLPHN